MNKFFFSFFLSVGLLSSPAFAASVGEKLYEKLQDRPVSLNIDLLDLNFGDIAEVEVETGIRVFPNKTTNSFSRSEPLKFEFNLGYSIPLGIVSVGAKQSNTLQGEFIRQFDRYKDAFNLVKYPPYIYDSNKVLTAERIPYTAAKAQALQPRDYFRYQIKTAIKLHGGLSQQLGVAEVQSGMSRILYGDFQIEIYKREDGRVLVRASSLKQKSKNFGFSFNNNYELRLFESKVLNKVSQKLIPDEIFELNIKESGEGALFSVEYVFDLSNPQAQFAYNQFMDFRHWNLLEVAKFLNPTTGPTTQNLQALTLHIDVPEDLSLLDSEKDPSKARVRRIVKSRTYFSESARGIKFDFKLIKASDRSNYVQQDIQLATDPTSDINQNYRIATSSVTNKIGGWLAFGAEEEIVREANVLFELNEKRKIIDFLEMNFSYEETDHKLSKRDLKNIQGQIYMMVPGIMHKGVMNYVNRLQVFRDKKVFNDFDIVYDRRSMPLLARLSAQEIAGVLDLFLYSIFLDQAHITSSLREYGNLGLRYKPQNVNHMETHCKTVEIRQKCFLEMYDKEIRNIKRLLPRILSISGVEHYEEQWLSLVELQKGELFQTLAPGIFTRLVEYAAEQENRNFYDYVYFRFSVQDRKGQRLVHEPVPAKEKGSVFNELIKIRNRILRRQYDPQFFEN